MCRNCEACFTYKDNPPKVQLNPWPPPKEPRTRIHVDFMGPFNNKYFLIIVNAYTKWPEVFIINSITTEVSIKTLRSTFARFGLPKILVSDNGRQLVSNEFETFLKMNKIEHITTPPFNPASNGAAENAVKTFKRALKAALHVKNAMLD